MRRVWLSCLLVVAVFGVAVTLAPSASGMQPATCLGMTVTVDMAAGQNSTPGDDVIVGTPGDDLIAGSGGNDTICGLGGDDQIWGQAGNDRIDGGPGNDRLRGGPGDDELLGNDGADDLNGGTGNDTVKGGAGADSKVRGGTGDDQVDGGEGDDLLIAGNGGRDTVTGGPGDDRLVTGGPRPDTVSGGAGDDVVKGHKGADMLNGNSGDDELLGGAQPDTMDGGDGTDTCNGGSQDDTAVNCETAVNLSATLVAAPPQDSFIDTIDDGEVVDATAVMDQANEFTTGSFELGGQAEPGATSVTVSVAGESVVVPVAASGDWAVKVSPPESGPADFTVSATNSDGTTTTETVTVDVVAPEPDEILVTDEYASTPDISDRLISYDAASGDLVFRGRHDNSLEPGMVLVGEPSGAAPEGYLRVVGSATYNGTNTIVATRPGALTDVLRRITFSETQTSRSTRAEVFDETATVEVGPGKFTLDVTMVLDYDMAVDIDWCTGWVCTGGPEVEELSFEAVGTTDIQPRFQAAGSVTLGPKHTELYEGKVASFWAGPVLMTVNVAAETEMGAELTAGVDVDGDVSVRLGGGYEYLRDGGGRGTYLIGPNRSQDLTVTLDAAVDADATLITPIKFKAYDLVGPEVRPRIGLEFEAEASSELVSGQTEFEYLLELVTGLDVALDSEFLSYGSDLLPTFDRTLIERRYTIAQGRIATTDSANPTPTPEPAPATPTPTPSAPAPDGPIVDVAAGGQSMCVLMSSGEIYCWGRNDDGQLGRGPVGGGIYPPGPVVGISTAIQIAEWSEGDEVHRCAVIGAGDVACWGANGAGQLGDQSTTPSGTPVQVQGVSDAGMVATGDGFSCAVSEFEDIVCWGRNDQGQLGTDPGPTSLSPVPIPGTAGATAIAAGAQHACAILVDITVLCWGGALQNAPLTGGIGSTRPVPAAGSAISIESGDFARIGTSCVAKDVGTVRCWGDDSVGQASGVPDLGAPHGDVPGITGAVDVTIGIGFACALIDTGEVKCWGSNHKGQLGRGTLSDSSQGPSLVTGIDSAIAISSGGSFSCAVTTNDGVLCWGANYAGVLGSGAPSESSVPIPLVGLPTGNSAAG